MQILFLTPCLPYPHGVGWQQRGFRHLKALAQVATVDTVVLSPDPRNAPEFFEPARALSRSLSVGPVPQAFERDKRRYLAERSAVKRLRLLLTTMQPSTVRPIGPSEIADAAKALPRRHYDLVFCFRMSSASWLQAIGTVPGLRHDAMVIDFDDIESRWHRQVFAHERASLSPAWRAHGMRNISLLYQLENRLLRSGWPVLCCSENDAAILRRRVRSARVEIIPNSIPVEPQLPTATEHDGCVALFVGALDNEPNRDGLHYFVEHIWPRVRRELGDTARLHVVGRNPLPDVTALDGRDGIRIIGPVPTMAPEYARAGVCVAPIRIGSGTRTKILEAFAQGCPVVSTHLGAEGLGAGDGNEICLADDPSRFADVVIELFRDPERRRRMAAVAHRFVHERYAEEVVAPKLQAIVLNPMRRAA